MGNSFINDFDHSNKLYYNDLKCFKSLSKKEEKKLCKSFFIKNDIEARNKLITSNLKFVVDIAKKYKGRGLSFADLVSEGNMGLLKSLEKFDYKKDYKLISYSVWWIKQYINDAINKNKLIQKDELPDETIKSNDDSYIDEEQCKEPIKNNYIEVTDNNDEKEYINIVKKLLRYLDERETEIITSYFGINCDEMTLEEIGLKYNLTKERVRQIKKIAMRKLRSKALELNVLDDIYN